VELSWQASKDGVLSTKTPPSTLGTVPAHGSKQVSPASTTTYHLEVRNLFGSAAREVDVDVRGPGGKKLIGRSVADPATTCANGMLTVIDDIEPTNWGSGLIVATVELPHGVDRTINVQHEDRDTELNSTTRGSDQFAGLPVVGKWQLRTPLIAGETCGTPTIPRNLTIMVGLACQ